MHFVGLFFVFLLINMHSGVMDTLVALYSLGEKSPYTQQCTNLVKSEVHPRTVHEGPEGEYMYSSTPSLTSALDEGGWSASRPGPFTPGERPGTHRIGGWVGPRASLDGCGKSRLHRVSIPGPSTP